MAVAYGDFSKLNYIDVYGIESTFVNTTVVEKIHKMNKKSSFGLSIVIV